MHITSVITITQVDSVGILHPMPRHVLVLGGSTSTSNTAQNMLIHIKEVGISHFKVRPDR